MILFYFTFILSISHCSIDISSSCLNSNECVNNNENHHDGVEIMKNLETKFELKDHLSARASYHSTSSYRKQLKTNPLQEMRTNSIVPKECKLIHIDYLFR